MVGRNSVQGRAEAASVGAWEDGHLLKAVLDWTGNAVGRGGETCRNAKPGEEETAVTDKLRVTSGRRLLSDLCRLYKESKDHRSKMFAFYYFHYFKVIDREGNPTLALSIPEWLESSAWLLCCDRQLGLLQAGVLTWNTVGNTLDL